jgi:HPt (histidine-containing phosphotransfer) domain-containing protein
VLDAGMDDYLSKPFRPSSVQQVLARLLRVAADAPARATSEACILASVPRSPKLIRLFLDRVGSQVDELETAVRSGDAPIAQARAHKLKGSCHAIGAEATAAIAEELQLLASQGELSALPELVKSLRAHVAKLAPLLRKELEAAADVSAPRA